MRRGGARYRFGIGVLFLFTRLRQKILMQNRCGGADARIASSRRLWVDRRSTYEASAAMTLSTLLLIVLVLLLIGGLPHWPYSRNWGYYPSAGLGTVLVIVLILVLLGRI